MTVQDTCRCRWIGRGEATADNRGRVSNQLAQSGAATAHALNWQRAWRQAEDATLKGAR